MGATPPPPVKPFLRSLLENVSVHRDHCPGVRAVWGEVRLGRGVVLRAARAGKRWRKEWRRVASDWGVVISRRGRWSRRVGAGPLRIACARPCRGVPRRGIPVSQLTGVGERGSGGRWTKCPARDWTQCFA